MTAAATGTTEPPDGVVARHTRKARWYHAAVYTVTAILSATGWWLLTGHEGEPSPLARIARTADPELHTLVGWSLVALGLSAPLFATKGARTFVRESLSFEPSDLSWFRAWPRAALDGRFAHHEGSFDPGQRVANVVMVTGLALLAASGAGLAVVHGGDAFVWLLRVHKWTTYVVTPVIGGHVLIAAGLVPGYRGVWRSMHWRGRLRGDVARRLWPAWAEKQRASD